MRYRARLASTNIKTKWYTSVAACVLTRQKLTATVIIAAISTQEWGGVHIGMQPYDSANNCTMRRGGWGGACVDLSAAGCESYNSKTGSSNEREAGEEGGERGINSCFF